MLHSLELKLQALQCGCWELRAGLPQGEQGLLTAFAVFPALNECFTEHGDNIVFTFPLT